MPLVVKDRVQETSTTTGTGTFTLAGAVSGFQSFSVIGDGNTTYYAIVGGAEWEVGLGTYTSSGTTLSRDTILESSNGGTAVNFSAGTKNVFVTYPAEKSLYLDGSNNAIGLGTVAATTTLTNATGLPISTGVSGLGTNVATALAVNVGSSGAFVTNGGALGTPSSGTVTNLTGTASININGTVGATTASTGAFTTLSATGVTTVQAGTALLPAITTTGDPNTGIFFPAADTIAFTEGGAEAMRIDSSGNVGIGTTSPISGRALTLDNASNYYGIRFQVGGTSIAQLIQETTGFFYIDSNMNNESGGTIFRTGSTERMRIDSSGNVGIGTTSPTLKFQVNGQVGINTGTAPGSNGSGIAIYASDFPRLSFRNSTTGDANTDGLQIYMVDNDVSYNLLETGYQRWFTGNTERMRITSGGEVYIAGTTDQGAYNLQCNGTGVWGAGAYVNGSDARIKENIVSIDSGLDVVNKLNPVTYKYKEDWSKDQSTQTGFIAQELLVALEGKNYVDGIVQQGGEYMSVAYQNIIPILTKAIQEQQTIINDLKARVTVLEAK